MTRLGKVRAKIPEFMDLAPLDDREVPVWSKYSNAERVSSLHLSRIDADIEDREAA